MKHTTLSAITALLIATTAIEATTSVSLEENSSQIVTSGAKDIQVVPKVKVDKVKPTTQPVVVNVNTPTHQVTVTEHTPNPTVKPTPTMQSYKDTITYAKAVKNNYVVGEEIKIKLSLKRDAYIYFWTVSADGKGYLILPNDLESFNKYKKETAYVVPEQSADYQFVSDRVGVEEVFVLATSKPISKHEITKIFKDKTSNIVPTAPKEKMRTFVSKDIVVLAKQEQFDYDIKSLLIGVREAPKQEVKKETTKVDKASTKITVTIEQ